MNLTEATALLGDIHGRVFAEVYKHYNYKDDAPLQDYLDFVVHEPREWMRGFPASWKSATMFGKPRAAFHKLLKDARVTGALGDAYTTSMHDAIWRAFKEHADSVLAERGGKPSPKKTAVHAPPPPSPALLPAAAIPVNELLLEGEEMEEAIPLLDDCDAASVHSMRKPRLGIQLFPIQPNPAPALPTKECVRCSALEGTLRALLSIGSAGADEEDVRWRRALAVALGL